MYFELAPKEKKADYFNHDNEYNELKRAIERGAPITAVLGVRRVGKTSLLSIVYNETKTLKLWADGRTIQNPKIEIPAMINEVIETEKSKVFGRIDGISVSAFGFGVGIKKGDLSTLRQLEAKAKKQKRIVVFIDEAQRMNTKALAEIISYFYDRLPQVSFVLSGSEVGLIEDILGENDASHALYGRQMTKITMKRFDRNGSLSFLQAGFKQLGHKPTEEELRNVIDELDGLAGWLTLYGYKKAIAKEPHALEETVKQASQIVASELENFLKRRKSRRIYALILRNTSGTSWTELKLRVEKDYKKQLNPNTFSFALNELVRYSFIENTQEGYKLCDPLIFQAVLLI